MSLVTSILRGGANSHTTTSEEANFTRTDLMSPGVVGVITNTSGVAPATGAYAVNAQGTPDMTVAVSAGAATVTATPTSDNSQLLRVKNSASANVTIAANATGGTRYDWVYIKIDPDKAKDPDAGADDVATLVTSRSTSNTTDNGTPPTYGTLLAIVTVANGASSIANGSIADKRVRAVAVGGINDTNGNEEIKVTATASAVNEITVTNAATGNRPAIGASGDDTNIGFNLTTKGTGQLAYNGNLGLVVQVVNTVSTAVATGSTQIPFDDTIPQITEGDEYMTLAITPRNTTNILVIDAIVWLSSNTASRVLSAALFQDSTANALAAGSEFTDTTATLVPRMIKVRHTMAAGTTSSTTFRIRAGANNTGTNTFNGTNAARLFGAITKSSIVITEYEA